MLKLNNTDFILKKESKNLRNFKKKIVPLRAKDGSPFRVVLVCKS